VSLLLFLDSVNWWAAAAWYGAGVLAVAVVRMIWFGVREHLAQTVDDAARRLGNRDHKEFDRSEYVWSTAKGAFLWPIALVITAGYLGSALALRLRR